MDDGGIRFVPWLSYVFSDPRGASKLAGSYSFSLCLTCLCRSKRAPLPCPSQLDRYAAPITTFRRQKRMKRKGKGRGRERETLYLLGLPHSIPLYSTPRCSFHCGRVLLRPFSMPGGAERFFFSFLLFFLLSEEKALNLAAVIGCSGVCTVL